MTSNFYCKSKVVGTHIDDRSQLIKKYVRYGSKFILQREPDNQFDENAICVKLAVRQGKHNLMLGYLPRDLAKQIAPLIDGGRKFFATFRVKIINEKTGKFIALHINILEGGK